MAAGKARILQAKARNESGEEHFEAAEFVGSWTSKAVVFVETRRKSAVSDRHLLFLARNAAFA